MTSLVVKVCLGFTNRAEGVFTRTKNYINHGNLRVHTPQMPPPPPKKNALLKGLLIIKHHCPVIRPYFLGGWHWGVPLDPHEITWTSKLFFHCYPMDLQPLRNTGTFFGHLDCIAFQGADFFFGGETFIKFIFKSFFCFVFKMLITFSRFCWVDFFNRRNTSPRFLEHCWCIAGRWITTPCVLESSSLVDGSIRNRGQTSGMYQIRSNSG